jgi:hypothetical protein
VSVWGSDAERRQCRREAFAHQMRFGQLSLFVTLTPNSENSFAMAHYSGIMSVRWFFDYMSSRVPSTTELRQAAMADDCSSARLFLRLVNAFIKDVLSFDPDSKRPTGRGLFGLTKAYYGMVETQGRGTLHIHFLIWISGLPRNALEFESRLEDSGADFEQFVAAYADSIVKTDLPFEEKDFSCSKCGAASGFRALPIQPNTRCNVKKLTSESREPLRRCYSHVDNATKRLVLNTSTVAYCRHFDHRMCHYHFERCRMRR